MTSPFIPLTLQAGLTLKAANGDEFVLAARLGGGKFSDVWSAVVARDPSRLVAVKIMGPDLRPNEQVVFEREMVTLHALASGLKDAGLALDGHPLVPELYAGSAPGQPPFFAMTVATGKPLDVILREDGYLEEPEVVTIGEQLTRVFTVLHTYLNRSYLDFQPRNVFWDARARGITVVDWNLLSGEEDRDVAGDIETVVALLYRATLGVWPRPGQLDAAERWSRLSAGLQLVLTGGLHPNHANRFSSIAEIQESLARLNDWWHCDEADLEQVIRNAATQPEHDPQATWCGITDQHAFGVARRRGLAIPTGSAIDRHAEVAGPSERIIAALKAIADGAFDEAQIALEQARQTAATSDERLWAWRLELTLGAAGVSTGDRLHWTDTLGRATALWRSGKTVEIEVLLRDFAAPAEKWPLSTERLAWQALLTGTVNAQAQDLDAQSAAVAAYREASSLVATLPYKAELLALWGNIENFAGEIAAQVEERRRKEAQRNALQAAFEVDPQPAVTTLVRELCRYPEDRSRHILAQQWTRSLLDAEQYGLASELVDSALVTAPNSEVGRFLELRDQVEVLAQWSRLIARLEAELQPFFVGNPEVNVTWEQILPVLAGFARCPASGAKARACLLIEQIWLTPQLPAAVEATLLEIMRAVLVESGRIEILRQRRADMCLVARIAQTDALLCRAEAMFEQVTSGADGKDADSLPERFLLHLQILGEGAELDADRLARLRCLLESALRTPLLPDGLCEPLALVALEVGLAVGTIDKYSQERKHLADEMNVCAGRRIARARVEYLTKDARRLTRMQMPQLQKLGVRRYSEAARCAERDLGDKRLADSLRCEARAVLETTTERRRARVRELEDALRRARSPESTIGMLCQAALAYSELGTSAGLERAAVELWKANALAQQLPNGDCAAELGQKADAYQALARAKRRSVEEQIIADMRMQAQTRAGLATEQGLREAVEVLKQAAKRAAEISAAAESHALTQEGARYAAKADTIQATLQEAQRWLLLGAVDQAVAAVRRLKMEGVRGMARPGEIEQLLTHLEFLRDRAQLDGHLARLADIKDESDQVAYVTGDLIRAMKGFRKYKGRLDPGDESARVAIVADYNNWLKKLHLLEGKS